MISEQDMDWLVQRLVSKIAQQAEQAEAEATNIPKGEEGYLLELGKVAGLRQAANFIAGGKW